MNTIVSAGAVGPDEKILIIGIYEKLMSGKATPVSAEAAGRDIDQFGMPARRSGLEILNSFLTEVGSAFPDYRLNINNLLIKGDQVMVRYTISGTHKNNFRGLAPTHTQMDITGIDLFRLDRGRVVEYSDIAHQIGVAR
jgi:predicted ester cyclase